MRPDQKVVLFAHSGMCWVQLLVNRPFTTIQKDSTLEISRWGEISGKTSQYVIQPYYIPANVVRFLSPAGRLTHSIHWEPGHVWFQTVRGSGASGQSDVVAAHVFTSGVPAAGKEAVRLHLYVFDNRRARLQHGVEVIDEKFEYLP